MKVIPIRVISTQQPEVLEVRFFPTDICNYSCSYCWPGSGNVNKFRYPKDVDLVIGNFRKLFDFYKTFGKTKFRLTIAGGGEPTLWPGLEQFCKEIKETHNVYISIVSNGSRTVRWWEENSAYFDDAVLSCHHEFVDIEHFVNVADVLFANGIKVTSLVLMDATAWDKCAGLIDTMKSSQLPWIIEAKPIVDAPGRGTDVYTTEQLEFFGIKRLPSSEWIVEQLADARTHESVVLFNDNSARAVRPHEILTNKWNDFKGWDCSVGVEAISITAEGKVLGSCQLPVFNTTPNIFSENFTLTSPKTVICTMDQCVCQPDTHVSKVRF